MARSLVILALMLGAIAGACGGAAAAGAASVKCGSSASCCVNSCDCTVESGGGSPVLPAAPAPRSSDTSRLDLVSTAAALFELADQASTIRVAAAAPNDANSRQHLQPIICVWLS